MDRPDRIALWAVGMCLLLILVAATSARAAQRERAPLARAAASLGERTPKVGKSGRDVRSLRAHYP